MFFRTPYTAEVNHQLSEATQIGFTQPSRTKQSYAGDADINNIVARFLKTGVLPDNIRSGGWVSQDFTKAPEDYQTAMHVLIAAKDQFMSLPAKLRDKFKNDPGQLESWLADPDNLEDSYKFGLRVRPHKVPSDDRNAVAPGVFPPSETSNKA